MWYDFRVTRVMALKYRITNKEEIPADQEGLYIERDGAWVLDVDGAVEKAKLDEFRSSNVALLKERDELKRRFDGIDPDEVRRLMEAQQRAEEEKLLSGGAGRGASGNTAESEAERERAVQAERERIEKVIEGRVKSFRGELEKQVGDLQGERDALNTRLASIQIDQGVITSATKRGLRPTAMADITARARSVFQLVKGVPTAFENDGRQVRYGKDGLTPLTIEEWVDAQVSEAPHLFEANSGGGSGSNNGSGMGPRFGGKNPFKRESWNLTEQMKLQKSDPGMAARLKAQTSV